MRRRRQRESFSPVGSPAQVFVGGVRVEGVTDVRFEPPRLAARRAALRWMSSPTVRVAESLAFDPALAAQLTARVLRSMERESRERWRARVLADLAAEHERGMERTLSLLSRVYDRRRGVRPADDTPLPLP